MPSEKLLLIAADGVRHVSHQMNEHRQRPQAFCADVLIHAGIDINIDARHPDAHNKNIMIDEALVMTRSLNFSKKSELSNAESLLIILDQAVPARYLDNWQAHRNHSTRYVGRGIAPAEPPQQAPHHRLDPLFSPLP